MRLASYQKRGVKKEAISFSCPVPLLQKVRDSAKVDRRSLNLAIVRALEMTYGQEEGEQKEEEQQSV